MAMPASNKLARLAKLKNDVARCNVLAKLGTPSLPPTIDQVESIFSARRVYERS